jgi:hypothetical protein
LSAIKSKLDRFVLGKSLHENGVQGRMVAGIGRQLVSAPCSAAALHLQGSEAEEPGKRMDYDSPADGRGIAPD